MTLDGREPSADAGGGDSTRRTRVKICGVTRSRDIDAVVAAGADAVGFVCDVPVDTCREVSVPRAAALVDQTPPFVASVLVTMASDPDRVASLATRVRPDAIQLHGEIAPGDLAYLRTLVDVRLLVAVDASAETAWAQYDELADVLVVDSADETGAGGTGETHDWKETRRRRDDIDSPVVLAGGLTPGNVAEAVRTVRPFAVDVSTGVEAEEGVKEPATIEAFVARARNALVAER